MASRFCQGSIGDNNHNCDCLRFIPQPDQDMNAPHLCRDCAHKQSSHMEMMPASPNSVPQPSASKARIQEILLSINRLRDAAASSTSTAQPATTYQEASLEANGGLASTSHSALRIKLTNARCVLKEGDKTLARSFQVGEAVLCVDGVIVSVNLLIVILRFVTL